MTTKEGVARQVGQSSTKFSGKIYIYPGDHNPPHFHIKGPNSNALIDLVTLSVIREGIEEGSRRSNRLRKEGGKSSVSGSRVEKAK
ncbi:DUF4160 domain-containing protein [Bradyrhizobium sp. NBAIM03]|nr:DUF4160 domain-containing protein [Bradyrhizobium sp. BRP05]MCA1393827.1 DUF4160 domain-containing protein [Bradyrhizobium sp. IC3123]MCA1423471.1 DUF4160 domain-containing protein [Bradyrhizobium sp. BRP23]MCA1430635.1 DUF4160 domain-containing protein [Bradyrhizobium sp. NBAIM16]MCA1480147.1 DUF4160 domain-containing protein [Bradyrhizobium sp. NBAIM08]MCA1500275.1 DUF4160 domain-containing protein [Bradyrhizobium sp. NBAIM14]MCA1508702.1 DUF4160 domain-containing protein [Bradyrhizobium